MSEQASRDEDQVQARRYRMGRPKKGRNE